MAISKTDVAQLSRIMQKGVADAALPRNLSDEVLLQIARDLRVVERACTFDESIDPPIAGVTYLVFHMMTVQAKKLTGKLAFQLELDRLQHWMQRYMHYVEREIVSRAVQMPCQADCDDLIAEVESEILFKK